MVKFSPPRKGAPEVPRTGTPTSSAGALRPRTGRRDRAVGVADVTNLAAHA